MAHNKTNINCSQKREKQQKLLYFSQRNPTQFKKVGTLYKVNAINRQTIDIHKIVDFDHQPFHEIQSRDQAKVKNLSARNPAKYKTA